MKLPLAIAAIFVASPVIASDISSGVFGAYDHENAPPYIYINNDEKDLEGYGKPMREDPFYVKWWTAYDNLNRIFYKESLKTKR